MISLRALLGMIVLSSVAALPAQAGTELHVPKKVARALPKGADTELVQTMLRGLHTVAGMRRVDPKLTRETLWAEFERTRTLKPLGLFHYLQAVRSVTVPAGKISNETLAAVKGELFQLDRMSAGELDVYRAELRDGAAAPIGWILALGALAIAALGLTLLVGRREHGKRARPVRSRLRVRERRRKALVSGRRQLLGRRAAEILERAGRTG